MIGMFEAAVRAALSEPEPITHAVSPKYTKFIAICRNLQQRKADQPIILSVRSFGTALAVSEQMVSLYIRRATRDGLLRLAVAASYPKHRAARYHFIETLA